MTEQIQLIDEWITDYENHGPEERQKYEEALKLTLESLKPLIRHSENYLCYAIAKGWFKLTIEERKDLALRNTLTTLIGHATKWSVHEAQHLAFETLQEVNNHTEALKVAKLLKLDLKPHEIE